MEQTKKNLEKEIREYNEFLVNDSLLPIAEKFQLATQMECEIITKYNIKSYQHLDELHNNYRNNNLNL